MARYKLSLESQLKGIKAAIRSKRTPMQLLEGLRKREEWLREQIGKSRKSRKSRINKKRSPLGFDW